MPMIRAPLFPRLAFVLTVVLSFTGLSNFATEPTDPSRETYNTSSVETIAWHDWLDKHLHVGDKVGAVAKLMSPVNCAYVTLYLGNSGNYARRYKISRFTTVDFHFDRFDSLQSWGFVQEPQSSMRQSSMLYSSKGH
jgi:hypothetical protein